MRLRVKGRQPWALIGVGGAVEERWGEAQGRGKTALVFVASRRISDGYSDCPSWEGTVRV